MDLGRGPLLPFTGCYAGLLMTMLAFADLPLLGGLVGSALSGLVAVLLAREPQDAPQASFLAGAAAVASLALLASFGGAFPAGAPLLAQPVAVLAVEAALLGLVPGTVAAVGARLVARDRAAAPPAPPSSDAMPSEAPGGATTDDPRRGPPPAP